MALRAGQWVEVVSRDEVFRTLDARGRLDGLPFMPQMLAYCGRRFRVGKSAHKTCDTVSWTGGRRLVNGVHLENLRCDGKAYGGCQAACLLFWKTAWLRPVDGPSPADAEPGPLAPDRRAADAPCAGERAVLAGALAAEQPASGGPRYACQATDLPVFTTPLRWWDARQYALDYLTGNASLARLSGGFAYAGYDYLARPRGSRWSGLSAAARWLYDRVAGLTGGAPFPRRTGRAESGAAMPDIRLDLQPGELVRVKSHDDILATIDAGGRNRGLYFDAEMTPYCGRVFRVRARVSRFVNEQTGLMASLKTPAVILEGVWCRSCYSDRRMHCPRSIYSWWREAWLERVESAGPTAGRGGAEEAEVLAVADGG